MTIHRALAELTLLEKRIERATQETFISSSVGGKAPRGFASLEEFNSAARSAFDSVTDLIKRRNLIKSAIIVSNATEKVTIAGVEMTVAEAIDQKTAIKHKEQLLNTMVSQYNAETRLVNRDAVALQPKLDTHLENMFSAKDLKELEKDVEAARKTFLDRNELRLADPLSLRSKITALTEEVENVKKEIDFSLSEANAVNKIEVPDTAAKV